MFEFSGNQFEDPRVDPLGLDQAIGCVTAILRLRTWDSYPDCAEARRSDRGNVRICIVGRL